jgi:hypothetical protein
MAENESQSLESSVLEWFQKQGYSLEMRVAKIFHDAGFTVSHFESYVDPESGTLREIDVVASVSHEIAGIAASAVLLVECKYSKDKPWVILTSPRRCGPFFCFSRVLRGRFDVRGWQQYETLQARLLARTLSSLGRESVSAFDFFRMPKRPGYGIVQALKGGQGAKDNAYSAVMQAHNCATAHDRRDEMVYEDTQAAYAEQLYDAGGSLTEFQLLASVAFPVVVTEGRVFECCLDAEGEVSLSETTMNMVLVPSKDRVDPMKTVDYDSVVWVVTEDSVEPLAAQAKNALDALLSREEALRRVWEYERSRLVHKEEVDEIPF